MKEPFDDHPLLTRTLHLAVLWSFAVAQPLFEPVFLAPDGGGVCVDPEPTICETYCDLQAATCTDANAIDFGGDTCLDACATWTEGTQETDETTGDVTGPAGGNTVACRIYHLTVAGGDPANGGPDVHCAHAAPDGGEVCVDDEINGTRRRTVCPRRSSR